jgi:hypothetical protein
MQWKHGVGTDTTAMEDELQKTIHRLFLNKTSRKRSTHFSQTQNPFHIPPPTQLIVVKSSTAAVTHSCSVRFVTFASVVVVMFAAVGSDTKERKWVDPYLLF